MTREELIALAVQTARAYELDPRLVCAVCEQESSFNPFAIRFEPAFLSRYVLPLNLGSRTEETARAFSWGIMQVMGQVAREHGFKGQFLSMLCEPVAGLDIGCRVLRSKLNSHPSTVTAGLLAYNGGGNKEYATGVIEKMSNYAI